MTKQTAYLFPGQGAQHVGMGQDIHDAYASARDIFDRAERATDLPVRDLCFDGPEEQLNRTDHAQPCIYTVSAAILAAMNEQLPEETLQAMQPGWMAGLSLGEYSALYAAGAMGFEDGLQLVTRRGRAMQQAAEARPSSMVAVMGLDEEGSRKLCEMAAEGQILTPANFNCPGQIVLSGETEACQRAAEQAESVGARGATVLSVAGAFHSEIMAPAADQLSEALQEAPFRQPTCRVLANVDALPYDGPDTIAGKLLAQLTGAVRWQQCMEALLAEGVETFYEIGPGKVLAGLMRRINRKATVHSINAVDRLEIIEASQ